MKNVKLLRVKIDDSSPIEIMDHRGLHFTSIDDVFVDRYARMVKPVAAMVYMVLCRHSGVNRLCWPSLELIADKAGVTTRTVKRGIKRLEFYRIIKVDRPRGMHNTYHLLEKAKWKELKSYYGVGGGHKSTKAERQGIKVTWEGEEMRPYGDRGVVSNGG